MKKHSYEVTIEAKDEMVEEFLKDLFGDTVEYVDKEKYFYNEKAKDARVFLNSRIEHKNVPKKLWYNFETIAVIMYLYGFNRAFEYYVEHKDIFNLESDEDTKQD